MIILNIRQHGEYIGEHQNAPKYEGQEPDIYTVLHPKGGQRIEIDGKTYVFKNKQDADKYDKHYAHEINMGWATKSTPFWKV